MSCDVQLAQRIAIIGNCGSGKTTVAFALEQQTGLPLYHIDQFCWNPGWERISRDAFALQHAALCRQERWIIEGLGMRLLPERVAHADLIIFLDVSRWRCLWRVIKRSLVNHGRELPGDPVGCKQSIFSRRFVQFLGWVWQFNARYRATILDLLDRERRAGKRVVVWDVSSLC